MADGARHDDEPPHRGASSSEVDSKFTLVTLARQAGPPDQRLLQPARRGPRHDRAAAGHLGVPQAAVDRLRGDRGRQDRRPIAGRRARRAPRPRPPTPTPTPADARRRRPAEPCSRAGAIVLGVSGGIAAYKAVEVCRRLVDAGAHVVPGPHRGRAALRRRDHVLGAGVRAGPHLAVRTSPDPIPHTRLGQTRRPRRRRARPPPGCSARTPPASPTTCSPPRCSPPGRRCSSCPAMHTEMWEHPAVQDNLRHAAPPGRARGRPRGGPAGRRRRRRRPPGRPGDDRAPRSSACSRPPATSPGVRVLVTAGGTREPIDPVRFIGNRSSGKQGHAVAEEAARPGRRGHARHHRRPARSPAGVEVVRGRDRGRDGATPCWPAAAGADVVVMAAAVADFRPKAAADRKIKKARRRARDRPRADPRHPRRPRARASRPARSLVGFAAETDDVRDQRRATSCAARALDLIVANDVAAPGRRLRARHQPGRSCSTPPAPIEEPPLLDKAALADVDPRRGRGPTGPTPDRRHRHKEHP